MFKLEHGRSAYVADFVLYGVAVCALSAYLLAETPRTHGLEVALLVIGGLTAWPVVEYAMHRYLLHSVQPFSGWHLRHHERPTARICTPTILSASLIGTLVFLPAWGLSDLWGGAGLTLGIVTGYLMYGITHHAVHHWRADSEWLKRRTRWHALHHHVGTSACFGVTTSFLDQAAGSVVRRRGPIPNDPMPITPYSIRPPNTGSRI